MPENSLNMSFSLFIVLASNTWNVDVFRLVKIELFLLSELSTDESFPKILIFKNYHFLNAFKVSCGNFFAIFSAFTSLTLFGKVNEVVNRSVTADRVDAFILHKKLDVFVHKLSIPVSFSSTKFELFTLMNSFSFIGSQ